MKTIIIDLDGTLIKYNSFTEFVKYSFRHLPSIRLQIAMTVALRKLRLITHARAKRILIKDISAIAPEGFLNPFYEILNGFINYSILRKIKEYDLKILATAAPSYYAVEWGKSLGFDCIIASETGKPENRGLRKLNNVLKQGVIFDGKVTVISDHHDDLPLFTVNTKGLNYLVNPSAQTQMQLKAAGVKFKLISD